MSYEAYNAFLSVTKSTPKEFYQQYFQDIIDADFQDTTTIKTIKHNNVDIETRVTSVFNKGTLGRSNYDISKIIFKSFDYVVNVGDTFEIDSENWICNEVNDNSWSKSCMITKCNNILKFYNESTVLYSVPCIFSDISIDLQEGRYIDLPIGHYKVIIPSGYITKDDRGLRFILNDSAYKIEGVSTATNGLTKIELVDDKFIPDDNRDLGIANYWSKQTTINTPPSTSGINIVVSPPISSVDRDSTLLLNALIYINGIEDTTKQTIWLLSNKDGSYNNYSSIEYNNRVCTLSTNNNYASIGKVIILRVALEEDPSIYIDKEIIITSLV